MDPGKEELEKRVNREKKVIRREGEPGGKDDEEKMNREKDLERVGQGRR